MDCRTVCMQCSCTQRLEPPMRPCHTSAHAIQIAINIFDLSIPLSLYTYIHIYIHIYIYIYTNTPTHTHTHTHIFSFQPGGVAPLLLRSRCWYPLLDRQGHLGHWARPMQRPRRKERDHGAQGVRPNGWGYPELTHGWLAFPEERQRYPPRTCVGIRQTCET